VSSKGIAAALNASLEKDAHVVSCSVAPAGGWDALDTVLDVVNDLHNKGRATLGKPLGTLVVWAVFNKNLPLDPKSLEGSGAVLAVAASDQDDNRVIFSGSGAALDLIAPGSAVAGLNCKSATDASITKESGSSFAAPCVAGVAAVVLSVNPNLKLDELKDIITVKSCDPDVPGKTRQNDVGWGRLNALRAVKAAKPAPPPAPPVI
jgi:thermitase